MYSVHDEAKTVDVGDIVPPGFYKAQISNMDLTNKDWGVGLKVSFNILEGGEAKGLTHNDFIILSHSNETAQRIGKARLADLMFAVGVETAKSEMDIVAKLTGKACYIQLKTQYNKKKGEDEVKFHTAWNPKQQCRSEHKLGAIGPTGSAPVRAPEPPRSGSTQSAGYDDDVPPF